MNRKQALADLIEKVEAGGDVAARDVSRIWPNGYAHAVNAGAGSLDAAKALHEAVLPGWGYGVDDSRNNPAWDGGIRAYVYPFGAGRPIACSANTPARAWLLAILKALHAQEDDE